MARSDLLVSLVRAGAAGDRDMLRTTAEALAADERAKKHNIVADRIQRALGSIQVAFRNRITPSAAVDQHTMHTAEANLRRGHLR